MKRFRSPSRRELSTDRPPDSRVQFLQIRNSGRFAGDGGVGALALHRPAEVGERPFDACEEVDATGNEIQASSDNKSRIEAILFGRRPFSKNAIATPSSPEVIQELGGRFSAGEQQAISSTGACNVEQMTLRGVCLQ